MKDNNLFILMIELTISCQQQQEVKLNAMEHSGHGITPDNMRCTGDMVEKIRGQGSLFRRCSNLRVYKNTSLECCALLWFTLGKECLSRKQVCTMHVTTTQPGVTHQPNATLIFQLLDIYEA